QRRQVVLRHIMAAYFEISVARAQASARVPPEWLAFSRALNSFDFIAFRCINEGDSAATAWMRPIRQWVTFSGCVFRKLVQIVHFECEMRQIGTNLHRTALIKFAKLDFLVAAWRFQEDKLRSAARCVSSNLFESENILVK